MTSNVTQEGAALEAWVAADLKTLSANGVEEGGEAPVQPVVTTAEDLLGSTEPSEEQPGSFEPEEEAESQVAVGELKNAVAELKSALDAKASRDETKALEATIQSLKDLFKQDEAKAEQEEESKTRSQQSLIGLQEKVTVLKSELSNLERTVRAGRAQEQVGPSAVPPEVLQQVYEEILTEILEEMTRLLGALGPRTALTVLENVRKSSSGTEFFRVEDDKRIVATGLAQAIQRGLLSPSQVHLTFGEFRRQLLAQVPRYRERGFEELVGARTSAYSVATIRRLVDQAEGLAEKLGEITGRLGPLEASVKILTSSPNDKSDALEQRT